MSSPANDTQAAKYDALFTDHRTHAHWTGAPVDEAEIRAVYDLAKWGPTSANCCPARLVFVRSPEGKARLRPHMANGNVDKTMAAPVTVIVGADMAFYDHLPRLYPHADARSWFADNAPLAAQTARDNALIQAAWLIMAARARGLDTGPMAGFDADGVKAAFFPDGGVEPVLLINIGHGDASKLHPRGPRFGFDEVCQIV
jgi:3-hydroxypropanoate dehydrogenase